MYAVPYVNCKASHRKLAIQSSRISSSLREYNHSTAYYETLNQQKCNTIIIIIGTALEIKCFFPFS